MILLAGRLYLLDELVYFYPIGHEAHQEDGHPERPQRVETIRRALHVAGCWEVFPQLQPLEVSEELLGQVHDPGYLARLISACRHGDHLDMDTYTTQYSWKLALGAAGGAMAVAEAVWQGRAKRGFALTRPPGHHATRQRGMGFCLLNNIALACEYLIRDRGARRLAIVDLDLHHGNGTQDIFFAREDVYYVSTHQSPLYPGTGGIEETGLGPGDGKTANFPLPPGSGDEAFRTITNEIILRLFDRFHPEMILVSFGFDPHWRDPLGHLMLTAQGYTDVLSSLVGWADGNCQGRIAYFLEGGYDLEAAAACGLAAVASLLGTPFKDPLGPPPHPEGRSWEIILRQARHIWGL